MKAYYDIVFKTSNKELNIDEENIRMLASHEAAHLTLSLLTSLKISNTFINLSSSIKKLFKTI